MTLNQMITSNHKSLPYELIIKLIYYLDSASIKNFNSTCVYIKKYYFYKVLVPYRILETYEDKEVLYSCDIKNWFKDFNLLYFENNNSVNINIYLLIKDILDIIDNTIIQNISNRIHRRLYHIMYNKKQYIHPALKNITMESLLNTNQKEKRNIRLHEIFRIPIIIYRKLRRDSFNVLALMY